MSAPSTVATEAAATTANPAPRGLWLWPAVMLVAAFWAFHFIFQATEATPLVRFLTRMGVLALFFFAFLACWSVNGRFTRRERLAAFAAALGGGVAAGLVAHPSLGVVGVLTTGVPFVATAWTLALLLFSRASATVRWCAWTVAILAVWALVCLLRMNGLSGDQVAAIDWRWNPSPEELFLENQKTRDGAAADSSDNRSAAPVHAEPGDWVAFRGAARDGASLAGEISPDWKADEPRLVWRKRVGPAWSSVIVVGGRLFTQEQRGEEEAVVCYDAATGDELWIHSDPARFSEQVAGAGPRATPTFDRGRIFTLGGTGIVNCLDAATGKHLWSHHLATERGSPQPRWGFSSSPLAAGGRAIVFAGGKQNPSLVAYDAESGKSAWSHEAGPGSYSSPQLATIAGKEQLLMLSDMGLYSIDPETGKELWRYEIAAEGAPMSIQPHVVGDRQVLVASATAGGLVLLDVKPTDGGWQVEQRWASRGLKPSFNDFVIVGDHAFGFDVSIFACIDLKTGKRAWKKGRYGAGQVISLPERRQLLVLSENGEIVLLDADPARHREVGKFQAIAGKTWNHPVLVRGRLYLRNGEEMACYDLSTAEPRSASAAPAE